jgi:hypothetical protein
MSTIDAYIGYERTEEEMVGRHCTCPENPNVDEWGDNSWLPCMAMDNGMFGNPEIICRNCMYCQKVKAV